MNHIKVLNNISSNHLHMPTTHEHQFRSVVDPKLHRPIVKKGDTDLSLESAENDGLMKLGPLAVNFQTLGSHSTRQSKKFT